MPDHIDTDEYWEAVRADDETARRDHEAALRLARNPHHIGDLAPPNWPGPVTCDDLVAVACGACGLPFLRPYSAVRPTQCTGCDEIDRIEA